MTTYNNAFTLGFSVTGCKDDEGNSLTGADFRKAIEARMADLDSAGDKEWQEAIGAPFDSFEEEEAEPVTYEITASEVTLYRGTVTGKTLDEIVAIFEEDDAITELGLTEYDGEAVYLQTWTEKK